MLGITFNFTKKCLVLSGNVHRAIFPKKPTHGTYLHFYKILYTFTSSSNTYCMLKKQKVLVYLSQILCVRLVENKAGDIVSKIDPKASGSMFSMFPDRKTADFPANGLAVSKAGYYRKRYFNLYKQVPDFPENPVGINRHKIAIKLIESYGIEMSEEGKVMGLEEIDGEVKYELLERLIGVYMGRLRKNLATA